MKLPTKGIAPTTPTAHRATVRALLSGDEKEAIAMVKQHAGNPLWLKYADDIEFSKAEPRRSVLAMIRTLRK